jgi:hypothetical protein
VRFSSCFDEALLTTRQPTALSKKKIKEYLEQKEFDKLEVLLREIEKGNIVHHILQGIFPLIGWSLILPHAHSSQQTFQKLQLTREVLASQIQELESKLNQMKQQYSEVDLQLNQTQLASKALCEKLEEFAECETALLRDFQTKISSPDHVVEQMSMDDLNVALQIHNVGCLPLLIKQEVSMEAILYSLDFQTLNDQFPSLAVDEKLDLLYGVHMIESNCFDPKAHEENCGVCSNNNILELLRENGLSEDLCKFVPLENLKPKHLLVIPPKHLYAGLDAKLIPKIIGCLGKIKNAHKACLKV